MTEIEENVQDKIKQAFKMGYDAAKSGIEAEQVLQEIGGEEA